MTWEPPIEGMAALRQRAQDSLGVSDDALRQEPEAVDGATAEFVIRRRWSKLAYMYCTLIASFIAAAMQHWTEASVLWSASAIIASRSD